MSTSDSVVLTLNHANIDAKFATAPSKVAIMKFLEKNLIVSTISNKSSLGETSFLNSIRKKSKYRLMKNLSVEPVTAIAKTKCQLLVLPPQHFRRLPKKLVEQSIKDEHYIKQNFHTSRGKQLVVAESKRKQRKETQASRELVKRSQEKQQQALLESMQRVASELLEISNSRTISDFEEVASVASKVKSAANKMKNSVADHFGWLTDEEEVKKREAKVLKEIRHKSAQLSTNVYVVPLRGPIDHVSSLSHRGKNTLSLQSLGRRVRKRVVDSGLVSTDETAASHIPPSAYVGTNRRTSTPQDLVGRMAKFDHRYAGLMQDVFQDDSLQIYNKSKIMEQRMERLRQHALGSSSSSSSFSAQSQGLPTLYRDPSTNLKMVVAHLRKHNLNHVPGRHSGPPKQMPAWLSDGPRVLKIPKKGQILHGENPVSKGSHPLDFL